MNRLQANGKSRDTAMKSAARYKIQPVLLRNIEEKLSFKCGHHGLVHKVLGPQFFVCPCARSKTKISTGKVRARMLYPKAH
jgi:hypothetical protein